jgi:type IV pilus biogenesis protein PilP
MRIENNSSLRNLVLTATAFFVVLGLFPFTDVEAYAADAPLPAGALTTPAQTAVPSAPAAPQAVLSLTDPVKAPSDEMRKSVSAMEDKTAESAKNVVKHLDAAGDATTFADLNSARQAVTRIEAMIDVEKHLAELEKLRGERSGVGSSHSSVMSLSSAIPASALTPPPQMHLSPEKVSAGPEPVLHARPEISRISGTDGKYTAVLKLPGGEIKSVKVGDQLSNGEVVSSISASSVGVEGKGTSYALHIKNVDAIYSAMR